MWFDEYYKFNASKMTIHNNLDFENEELSTAVKNILRYYDSKAIGNYYDNVKQEISQYNINLNFKQIEGINFTVAKEKLNEYFNELVPKKFYTQLVDEKEYMDFINKSCSKIYKSL